MDTKRITLESDPAALRALLRGIAKQAPLGNRTLARIAHAAGGRYKACPHCGAPVSFIVGGRRDWAQCATWDRDAPAAGRCVGGGHIRMRALRTVDIRGLGDDPARTFVVSFSTQSSATRFLRASGGADPAPALRAAGVRLVYRDAKRPRDVGIEFDSAAAKETAQQFPAGHPLTLAIDASDAAAA